MPKATAVWLIDNTTLTFEQIGDFCGLHPLEIKGIADGEVAQGIQGQDPIAAGQLTKEEIARCEKDQGGRLRLNVPPVELPDRRGPKGARYTPLSKRQDRPNAIAWLVRHHPELSDATVGKLVGTTKPTIQSVRERSHWNMQNIKPMDPVTLGLCSQTDLDTAVREVQERQQRQKEREEHDQELARIAQFRAAQDAGLPSAMPVEDEEEEEVERA